MLLLETLTKYAPVASPILSPFIAAATAILLYQRKERERIHGTIDWRYVAHPDGADEAPFLIIHNRSDRSIAIRDLRYRSGGLRRKRSVVTALGYEEPEDVNFPYLVEPGALKKLPLDLMQAMRLANETSPLALLLSRVGRARIIVEAVTTAGKRLRLPAEEVIPWNRRPAWLQ